MRYDPNSRQAWDRFRKGSGELTVNGRIIKALSLYGPLSCEAIRKTIRVKHQTVSAQISHLRDDGELVIVRQAIEEGRKVNLYAVSGPADQVDMGL